MKVKFLKANNGDSILLSFKDNLGENRNILIDGGTEATYIYRNSKKKPISGDLKNTIDDIKSKNQKIDLLILTHIDDDHIGGLLSWIKNDKYFKDLLQEVWFNSGKNIFKYFKRKEIEVNKIYLKPEGDNKTSVAQGVEFENLIADFLNNDLILSRTVVRRFNVEFYILSPSLNNLKKLLTKWEKEDTNLLTSKDSDYEATLESLLCNTGIEEEDQAIHNGSSIAFILKYGNNNLLFLSDSHPSIIIESLNYFGYSKENRLKVDFVKVSHHGSKSNTNAELIKMINSRNYIISSNGKIHSLPDKACLATIIRNVDDPCIMFNYERLIEEIFTIEDLNKFKFSVTGIQEITI